MCLQEQKSTATGQSLVNLPEKSVETHPIKLSPEEQKVYDKVRKFVPIVLQLFRFTCIGQRNLS
jgi:hypothetical protein